MKHNLLRISAISFISILVICCARNHEPEKQTWDESLTLEQKAINTFRNTTTVFSGSMLLAFSSSFREKHEEFSSILSNELDSAALVHLDEQINKLGQFQLQAIDSMIIQFNRSISEASMTNVSLYQKMFMNELIREGVAITEKYDLPEGFRPLSQNLSNQEVKRYIVKITASDSDFDDPIIKTYRELFEWFHIVGEQYKDDPEVQQFLNSIRK